LTYRVLLESGSFLLLENDDVLAHQNDYTERIISESGDNLTTENNLKINTEKSVLLPPHINYQVTMSGTHRPVLGYRLHK